MASINRMEEAMEQRETIHKSGGCFEFGHDYDADKGRRVWDEYGFELEVHHIPGRHPFRGTPYEFEYGDYHQIVRLTEEQLREIAKLYADAVAAIGEHRAASKAAEAEAA